MIVAVLSDIHSNLVALEAVLASIGSVDALWHLGDVVGYGPEPDAVVERLRGLGAVGVRGNHDDAALTGRSSGFNPIAARAAEWTHSAITDATAAFLAGLPLVLEPAGSEFTLVHGTPADPLEAYLETRRDAAASLADVTTTHCLVGHSHVPLAFRLGGDGIVEGTVMTDGGRVRLGEGRCVLNPGSVGQPRDRDPRAAWMLLDTDSGLATWRRVRYDVAATQAAILAAGLPRDLATRLAIGW